MGGNDKSSFPYDAMPITFPASNPERPKASEVIEKAVAGPKVLLISISGGKWAMWCGKFDG